jgi:hypothetical protein
MLVVVVVDVEVVVVLDVEVEDEVVVDEELVVDEDEVEDEVEDEEELEDEDELEDELVVGRGWMIDGTQSSRRLIRVPSSVPSRFLMKMLTSKKPAGRVR